MVLNNKNDYYYFEHIQQKISHMLYEFPTKIIEW